MTKFFFVAGAIICAVSVALGAFGTHGLSESVTPERLNTWQTAAKYLMSHGLGILVVNLTAKQLGTQFSVASFLLTAGVSIFSASLFLLVILDSPWLGAVAPVGGLFMISGWLSFAIRLYRIV